MVLEARWRAGLAERDLNRQNRRKQAEGCAMPAQESVGLNDLQDGLPVRNEVCEDQQGQPFAPGQARGLDLAVQDDHVLAQQGVLGEQFRAAPREIRQRARDAVGVSRLHDETEEVVGSRQACPPALG